MTEREEGLQRARRVIVALIRARGWSGQEHHREQAHVTAEMIREEIRRRGIGPEIGQQALDSLVADKTVKQSPDVAEDFYTLRECDA